MSTGEIGLAVNGTTSAQRIDPLVPADGRAYDASGTQVARNRQRWGTDVPREGFAISGA